MLNLLTYPKNEGKHLASHLDTELSEMLNNLWSTNGLRNLSITALANSSQSSIEFSTLSLPARNEANTNDVWDPLRILTFLSLYGWWSLVNTTLSPASLNGSSFSSCSSGRLESLSTTQRPNTSALSISWSSYPHSSQSLAASSLGYPGTILSTSVGQNEQ